jgi:hypothetical protein
MLLLEIQENITKAQNALRHFEGNTVYKVFKTFGAQGNFEQSLRNLLNELIGLRNSFISHSEAIIRISENKDLLMMIDSGYFERYAQAASVESLIRVVSGNGFQIPETSMRVVAENKLVINELQAINTEIKSYNGSITAFRQKNNKYFITLYRVPVGNELPDLISGTVTLEGVLPNANAINAYIQKKHLLTHKTAISIQKKNESNKIEIIKKDSGDKKINITKRK